MRFTVQFRGKPLGLIFAAAMIFAAPPAGRGFPEPQSAAASGQELRQLVRSGSLPGIRWPDFSNLRASLEQVYEQNGYAPLWVRDGRFTSRAHSVLATLRDAMEKGLDPEDYDVSLLLQRDAQPAWQGRGDLGLTIALMRSEGSLHEG